MGPAVWRPGEASLIIQQLFLPSTSNTLTSSDTLMLIVENLATNLNVKYQINVLSLKYFSLTWYTLEDVLTFAVIEEILIDRTVNNLLGIDILILWIRISCYISMIWDIGLH